MYLKNWIFYLFSVYPIAIIIGNLAINLIIILIATLYIFHLSLNKSSFLLKDKLFILLVFFFISLIINLFFSNDVNLSYPRVLKFFFIIFFILSFNFLLKNFEHSQIKKIYTIWFAIFFIILIDLLIEYLSGKNIIGLISTMPGQRLASFTGGVTITESESVIGYFFYGFVLIFLSIFYQFFKNQKINIILAYFLILVSFLIGERSNFIKVFIIINVFTILVYEIKFRTKILFFLILTFSLITFVNFNHTYKVRYYNQIKNILKNDSSFIYINNSQYGAHYNVAKKIFIDNPIFGVGIKNFRIESGSKKYENLDHPKNHLRIATHPHQIHYEFLSETGLIGYLSFLIFIILSLFYSIKTYIKNKNIFQLSGILFVTTSILPMLPSGSFLSTFSSSVFWINYSIMMGYIYSKSKIKY